MHLDPQLFAHTLNIGPRSPQNMHAMTLHVCLIDDPLQDVISPESPEVLFTIVRPSSQWELIAGGWACEIMWATRECQLWLLPLPIPKPPLKALVARIFVCIVHA
jgi:hypothetical protein